MICQCGHKESWHCFNDFGDAPGEQCGACNCVAFEISPRDAFFAALNRPTDTQIPLEDQMIARHQRTGDEVL